MVNDTRLDIPPGILSEETEGVNRQIRVWNTIGPSGKSPQVFNIYTGRAVVTGTMKDKTLYDRGQSLRVFGYGFRSTQGRAADGNATLSDIRVEDNLGNVVFPTDLNSSSPINWQVISDGEAIMPMNTLSAGADGFWRRIRASRGNTSTLSPASNEYISLVSGELTVAAFTTIDLNGTETDINSSMAFRRDRAAEIRGTGLNAVSEIRISRLDGTGNIFISFSPYNDHSDPNVTRFEPYPGVIVDDNGSRIQISKDVFKGFENEWQTDGHTADDLCLLTLGHLVKNYQSSSDDISFNVNVQPEISGIGGFTVANTFNRSPLEHLGDDALIVGSGFLAVKEIRMVDENGTDLAGTPNIVLSAAGKTPGVTQTDTSLKIDTSVMQFNNAPNADSSQSNYHRRFRLVTDRDDRYSSQAARFIVGVPPTYTLLTGIANTGVDLRRDLDGTTFSGTALQLLTKVEIVDINGNPIAAGAGVIPPIQDVYPNLSTDLSARSSTGFTIDANATTWLTYGNNLDTSTILSDGNGIRRLRVTTPFGVATSTMADGFTVSATPDYLPAGVNTSMATFAGTTDANASNTVMDYNASNTSPNINGELFINGSNFRGVKTITFEDSGSNAFYSIGVDPNAPPSGILFNPTGTQVSITGAFITQNASAWAASDNVADRRVRLTSASGVAAFSPNLITLGGSTFVSLTGTGYTAPHYQRSGTFIITGTGTPDLTTVTAATLVDAAGNAITGVAPIAGGSLTLTTTSVTISADAFDTDGNFTDSLTVSRRVKLSLPTGDLVSTRAFTVSSPPDVATAAVALVYATTGAADGGAATAGAYSYIVGSGDISLTGSAPTEDMNGVKTIEFYDVAGSLPIAGAPVLTPADWTVSLDGKSITIPKANVSLLWATSGVVTANRGFRLTTAAGVQTVSRAISATSP
jgi:hypothetical protein